MSGRHFPEGPAHGHGRPHRCECDELGNVKRAFGIGTALNLAFVLGETYFGLRAHSLALLADAGHNLSDVFCLVFAWAASYLGSFRRTKHRTYGLRSSSILAALFNAILLLVAVGGIGWEALRRLQNPAPVSGRVLMGVAAVGVVVNTVTALLFLRGRKADLNVRGAFLHMAADAAVSLGVVAAGWVVARTKQYWIDPAASLVIVAIILGATWGLLRDSLDLALHAVPRGIDPFAVESYLASQPSVGQVHDLHIWGMSTTETALTAHLIMPEGKADDAFLARIQRELDQRFGIHHITLQVERGSFSCPQSAEESV